MTKKRILIFTMLTALIFTGCGSAAGSGNPADTAQSDDLTKTDAGAADGEALKIAIKTDIVTMDVQRTSNDYLVPMNVFDTLFQIIKKDDGSTEIVNSLADKYEISEDGKTYHFTLRDDVVFSDGTPLTASDVKFTFERMLTIPDGAQTDYAMPIEGAQDVLDGKAKELSGIKVEDDHNLTITLSAPFAGFIATLATPSTSILSEKIVTEAGDDFGVIPEKTLGSGPYVVKEWTKGSGLLFEYNPKYWGEAPTAKRIEVTIMEPQVMNMAFQKGDLDIIDCMMIDSAIVDSTYKTDEYKDRIVSVDRLGLNFLMLNENIEPLNDVNVRKAIQLAIDRESILASIYEGDGHLEDGIYPTGCLGYSVKNQGWLDYNPEAAKNLLEDAGYSDGFDMEICMDTSTPDASQNTTQVIVQNLNDIGIRATIRSVDHASFLDLRNSGEAPAYLALWILDYNDPDNIIYTFFGSKDNTVIRSDNYPDETVIDRVASAKTIVDDTERYAEYAALEKKLVQEDAVWVPMFSLKHNYVVSERVSRFTPHWAGWSDIYFSQVVLK
ncbi:MAG: ABC transporter substrate-binding protein [Lachnospiraceae bacterium]|nr:ABC transporter substrate-binding protein [Lachnospiraceae bacterium]